MPLLSGKCLGTKIMEEIGQIRTERPPPRTLARPPEPDIHLAMAAFSPTGSIINSTGSDRV